MHKRSLLLVLIGAMLLSGVSCQGEDQPVSSDSLGGEDTVPVDTDHDANGFLLDTIPADTNFEGATVNILIREAIANTEFFVEEETGDIVDDALYERNATVEERLGVDLNFIPQPGEWPEKDTFNGLIKNSVMAADGAYDLCAVLSNQLSTLTLDGLLTNLNSLDYLDFEKPWWAKGLLDELAVDDKLYFA